MDRLRDRVAIVTGTARGIGSAIARLYADEGAIVIGIDVNGERGQAAVDALVAAGGRAEFFERDVSDERAMVDVVERVHSKYGHIDVLVNNAVYQREARFLDATVTDFERQVAVNLFGPFVLSRAVLPIMIAQAHGSIVMMSSLMGISADPLLGVYSMTKHGIIGIMKNIAITYGQHGVRCNAILPGDVDTELNQGFFEAQVDPVAARAKVERFYPMRRMASQDEIAAVALFLASEESSFVNGSEIVVDGGLRALCYEL